MAAIGPDFKKAFVDPAPISNADLTPTLAYLFHLPLPAKGALGGRVIGESLVSDERVAFSPVVLRSEPAKNGFTTVLKAQRIGDRLYFDAAGMPGRVIGLDVPSTASAVSPE